jgi:hypothetical protein
VAGVTSTVPSERESTTTDVTSDTVTAAPLSTASAGIVPPVTFWTAEESAWKAPASEREASRVEVMMAETASLRDGGVEMAWASVTFTASSRASEEATRNSSVMEVMGT